MFATQALLSDRFADNGRTGTPVGRLLKPLIRRISDTFRRSKTARNERESCPLCKENQTYAIAEKDRHGIPVPTQVCKSCGLVFSGLCMTVDFAAAYYQNDAHLFKATDATVDELFQRRIAPDSYAWSRHRFVKKTLGSDYDKIRTVVELGCGDGCNLYPYHQDGKKVIGFDLDQNRFAAGQRTGLDLRVGGVDYFALSGIRTDLVILSHVLEHMHDVDQTLGTIRDGLSGNTYLYIEVPGIEGLIKPMDEFSGVDGYQTSNDLLGYLQFEHNFCFDLSTLTAFAERNGLK
ncbi:MAG: methyltransferase domain-containing protein, partial [Rhodospirillales bacterium]